MSYKFIFLSIIIFLFSSGFSQPEDFNYDESKVPEYILPDPLENTDGSKVTNTENWIKVRRPEILRLFKEFVYGKFPSQNDKISYQILETNDYVFHGLATRKQVRIYLIGEKSGPFMDVLIYLPNENKGASPLFVGLNFYGNHTIDKDSLIIISDSWMPNNDEMGITAHKATRISRGKRESRWPVEYILKNGYGLATIYCGDIDPDRDDFTDGIHPFFYKENQSKPEADEWGTIGAWAWGLSRAMDYFEQDKDIDKNKVIVMGHSRLGKTALWAGASDQRFAITISNNSGCGGAALSRREFGETVKRINKVFPYWFCDHFTKYNDNVDSLPVDQHMLVALIAPRPCYIASAEEDLWADPHGEFLSAKHATPVYKLFDKEGLPATEMPALGEPVMGTIGYHIRPGKHDVTLYDWQQYIKFADKRLK